MPNKNSIYKKPRIQKFKGKFKEIDGGGTILFTKTIQSITDPNCLAIYAYLASKPPEWNINVKEIMNHFIKMGRDKVRKALNDLCLIGLLERKELRTDGGSFKEYQYYLYLEPLPENQVADSPLPDLPAPVLPSPANQGPYKEKMGREIRESKKDFSKTHKLNLKEQDKIYEKRMQEYKESTERRSARLVK